MDRGVTEVLAGHCSSTAKDVDLSCKEITQGSAMSSCTHSVPVVCLSLNQSPREEREGMLGMCIVVISY